MQIVFHSYVIAIVKNIVIHLGFPKTATTWLQRYVFSDARMGFCSPWGDRAGIAIDQFVAGPQFAFDANTTRQIFDEMLQKSESDHRLIPILSEETLIGDPCSGRYWGESVANRLHATFPEAKIVITIREQNAFVLSAYKEYVRNGGTASIERFLGRGVELRPGFSGICQLNSLEYDLPISYYKSLFGIDRVLVLAYEELLVQPESFIQRLANFAGVSSDFMPPLSTRAHRSELGATIVSRRLMNRYIPKPDFATQKYPMSWKLVGKLCSVLDRGIPSSIHNRIDKMLRVKVETLIGDSFVQSNRRTDRLIDSFQLGNLGYAV